MPLATTTKQKKTKKLQKKAESLIRAQGEGGESMGVHAAQLKQGESSTTIRGKRPSSLLGRSMDG